MLITRIEEQKKNKNRFNLYLNNQFAFGLDEEIMYRYGLKEGKEISGEFIEDIIKKEQQIKANDYAIRLLDRSNKTIKQLQDKMKEKGYEEELINNTIDFLKKYNYVNDEIYTKNFINDKLNFNKDGRNKIKMNLIQKGVDKEIISQCLDNINQDFELENAYSLAQKKVKSYKSIDLLNQRKKLFSFLINKGYNYDIAKKVIEKIFSSEGRK